MGKEKEVGNISAGTLPITLLLVLLLQGMSAMNNQLKP
jgi:hypothetical protein